jgi:hypothetical protein
MISKVKTGLSLGIFIAVLHLIWAIAIAIGIAQPVIAWILSMHMLQNYLIVTSFSIVHTLILVVMTFISGFIFGWLFALFWNMFHKE